MKLQPVRANTATPAATATGERKTKYYRSTMNPGEVSEKPGKDTTKTRRTVIDPAFYAVGRAGKDIKRS